MANPYYDPPEKLAAFHDRRRHAVGASESAKAAGLSRYGTPLGVWLDKVEPAEADEPTEAMRWGHLLEPAIARGYELWAGCTLTRPEPVTHPYWTFMGASPDYRRDDGRLVQIKNVGRDPTGEWGEPGTDEVPREVLVQVQHEMSCCQAERCDVAALFGGNELRVYPVRLNEQLVKDLAGILGAFWKLVESRTPPEPDWLHPTTPALIDRLHRPRAGVEVELQADVAFLAFEYLYASEGAKKYEAERRAVKAKLVHAMGDAARARCGGFTLRRAEIERRGYTVEPTTYTDFRITPPKPLEDE